MWYMSNSISFGYDASAHFFLLILCTKSLYYIYMPIDTFSLGHTSADIIRADDFYHTCDAWLDGSSVNHVVTLNPEMVMEAKGNADFRDAINSADMRIPDGAGLIWAHWYIRSEFWSLIPSLVAFSFRSVERITGVDIVVRLSQIAEKRGVPVYLLGGTTRQVERTKRLLARRFPALSVHTSSDHVFDISGPSDVLADIQRVQPAILFVAYGAPKQALWIQRHKKEFSSVRIAVGVGGAFAILSEEKRRAPDFLRALNLEWLWRLFLEPSRLPRIWTAVVKFPRFVHRQKVKKVS